MANRAGSYFPKGGHSKSSYFPFGFESWIWVLIASVPDLCILFTFHMTFCPESALFDPENELT